jgi:hypothetical protein
MDGSYERREAQILQFLENSDSGHASDDLECYSNGSSDSETIGDDEIMPNVILPSKQPIPSTSATQPTAVPRDNSTAADRKWDNISNNPNTNACRAMDEINATVLRRLGQNPSELDVTNEFMTTQFWEKVTMKIFFICLQMFNPNRSRFIQT